MCIIIVCACVHLAWCSEAFVDVNILGAGDNLLSNSAAGKARYIMHSSRGSVENRCVSTPARKDHAEPRALDGARYFFLFFCTCSPICPFQVLYKGKRKYSSPRSPKPSRPASTATTNEQRTLGNIPLLEAPNLPVRRQQQPPTSNEHSCILRDELNPR